MEMKKKLLFLLLLILGASGITALIAAVVGSPQKREGKLFVTSFYPVWLLSEAVTEGAEDVRVVNLTANHSGCLHDYALTTQDMRLLSEADLFLVNGGGMELFLTKAARECKGLVIVDTSEGFAFLKGVEHEEDWNAHIWLDIDGYLWQLDKIESALCAADPAQAELYRKNAAKCREELFALKGEYEEAKEALEGRNAVVFHEGFVYLLNMLGIETLHCLPMDSETQILAGEAAEIAEECRLHGVRVFFVEEDYADLIRKTFGAETGCEIVCPDAISGGSGSGAFGMEVYLAAMRDNLEVIKEAYGIKKK